MKVQKKKFHLYISDIFDQTKKEKQKQERLDLSPSNSTEQHGHGWLIDSAVSSLDHWPLHTNIDLLVTIIMMLICHIKVITVENEKKKSIDRSRSIVRSFSQPVVLFGSFIQIIRSRFKKTNLFHSIPFFILKSKFKLKVHLWKQKKSYFSAHLP